MGAHAIYRQNVYSTLLIVEFSSGKEIEDWRKGWVRPKQVEEDISRIRESGPIKLIANSGPRRSLAAGCRVISSGNSVHDTITIALPSRFLSFSPPEKENLLQLVKRAAADQEQNWAKTVGNGFWSTFSSPFLLILPSFPLFVEIFPRETL